MWEVFSALDTTHIAPDGRPWRFQLEAHGTNGGLPAAYITDRASGRYIFEANGTMTVAGEELDADTQSFIRTTRLAAQQAILARSGRHTCDGLSVCGTVLGLASEPCRRTVAV